MHNIFSTEGKIVQREEKERLLNQKASVFWLTGLSGSGKSTIAQIVERRLFQEGYLVQLIDGDNVRAGLCVNLSFSIEDRKENIRRIAELSKIMLHAGVICINTFVSPTLDIRSMAASIIGENDYHEVFINTPLAECEKRDVKGLYKKARKGEIKNFTGIDSPFESPLNPAFEIKTENQSIEHSANELYEYIKKMIAL